MVLLVDSIDYDTDPPTIDPQIVWYEMQQHILNFLEHVPPERQMRLRGEDVLRDPKPYLKDICAWLGLPHDDHAMECMVHPEDSPYASLGPWGAHLGNDPNFLHAAALRPNRGRMGRLDQPLPWRADNKGFRDEVIELAQRLGYE